MQFPNLADFQHDESHLDAHMCNIYNKPTQGVTPAQVKIKFDKIGPPFEQQH